MGYYSSGYPPYVPVAQRRAKAQRKLQQMRKKNPNLKPIFIEGKALATTWWGKSWNRNLERYADYSNRIGRGRSYVRHGAVLDLQLHAGSVAALVQGSRSQPYKVGVKVSKLNAQNWRHIRQACEGNFDSLSELLAGKFPKALQELFFADGSGLFPTPDEIEFDCSCPDWAFMCKHVAAVLYGVGARLDEDPSLFFTLRNIQIDDMISETVVETTQALLSKADTQSDHVLDDVDLGEVFGIELDDLDVSLPDLPSARPAPAAKKTAQKKASAKKKAAAKKKATPKKKAIKPTRARIAAAKKAVAKKAVAKRKKPATKPAAPARRPARRATQTSPDLSLEMQAAIEELQREFAAMEARQVAVSQPWTIKKRAVVSSPAPPRGTPAPPRGTMEAALLKALGKARKGKAAAQLQEKLGWTKGQVMNTLRRATVKGLVESSQPGLYRRVQ